MSKLKKDLLQLEYLALNQMNVTHNILFKMIKYMIWLPIKMEMLYRELNALFIFLKFLSQTYTKK